MRTVVFLAELSRKKRPTPRLVVLGCFYGSKTMQMCLPWWLGMRLVMGDHFHGILISPRPRSMRWTNPKCLSSYSSLYQSWWSHSQLFTVGVREKLGSKNASGVSKQCNHPRSTQCDKNPPSLIQTWISVEGLFFLIYFFCKVPPSGYDIMRIGELLFQDLDNSPDTYILM